MIISLTWVVVLVLSMLIDFSSFKQKLTEVYSMLCYLGYGSRFGFPLLKYYVPHASDNKC